MFLTVLKYANNIDYSVKKVLYRKEIKVMLKKEMSLHDYYYDLPEELIAQDPLEDRSSSRLMVLDKNTGEIEHHIFKDIIDYLNPNDCLVINDTKVIPARLYGSKVGTDAKIEVLLLKRKENDVWETLVKPGKKCKPGTVISFGDGILTGEVIDVVEEGNRLIKFTYEGIFEEVLDKLGEMPLPPYITHKLEDKNRYQTVYAKYEGSTLEKVAELRNQVAAATSPAEAMRASDELTRQVSGIFAVAESYPDLKASANFSQLQEELTNTENKIAYSRQLYNSVTSNYNVKLETFPSNVIAKMFSFKAAEFLETPEEEKAVPKVDFSGLGN